MLIFGVTLLFIIIIIVILITLMIFCCFFICYFFILWCVGSVLPFFNSVLDIFTPPPEAHPPARWRRCSTTATPQWRTRRPSTTCAAMKTPSPGCCWLPWRSLYWCPSLTVLRWAGLGLPCISGDNSWLKSLIFKCLKLERFELENPISFVFYIIQCHQPYPLLGS